MLRAPRQHRGRVAAATAGIACAALAGCGSGATTTVTVTSPTTSPVGSTSPAASSTTASSSASSSGTGSGGGPAIFLVWTVTTSSGDGQVRVATVGGGPARPVVSFTSSERVLAVGSGHVAISEPSRQLKIVRISDGSSHLVTGPTGDFPLGAALSPDGTRLAYVDAVNGQLTASLKVTDLVGGHTTTLRTFSSNRFDVPTAWTADAMLATEVVFASDAGPQSVSRLDPVTGSRTATSSVSGDAGVLFCTDGQHVAVSRHSQLGDDADAQPGPGPQGPFNTLQLLGIGGASTALLSEAHHNIAPLAGLPDGSTLLVTDQPAAGGSAGISMSPDFGIFTVQGTARTQLAHYDGATYDGGTFYQDGATVAVGLHDASGSRLVQMANGHAPITLDTVAGGTQEAVYLVADTGT